MAALTLGSWIFALQDSLGSNLSLLAGAYDRHLSYKRSSTPEAKFSLELEHDDAYSLLEALRNGLPRLRAFRVELMPDLSLAAVVRYGGIILPLDEKASDGTIEVTSRGMFELFEGRDVGAPEAPWARDMQDVGVTIFELIDMVNAELDTGIVKGTRESSIPVDVTYEGKRVSDGIIELLATANGPDLELVPVADATGQGWTMARAEVYSSQGVERPGAVFGYGAGTVGNCSDAGRQTTKPRNRVTVYGDEGIFGYAEDFGSQIKYGLWGDTDSLSDTIDVSLLDARARELLQPEPFRVVTFNPDPTLVAADGTALTPSPWRDYWLGDSVPLSVRKGAFTYDGMVRVDGIDIDIDDDGFESSHGIIVSTEEG